MKTDALEGGPKGQAEGIEAAVHLVVIDRHVVAVLDGGEGLVEANSNGFGLPDTVDFVGLADLGSDKAEAMFSLMLVPDVGDGELGLGIRHD